MARGEGDSGSGLRSHFVERVVKLPMMHVVLDYASNTYSHIKESNKLVNFTLTNAEKTATFVAGQAKPVVLKFEKQIQAVDDLACKGLGTLEEKVPFITKPADEIIGDTRKLYDDTVNSRLENIRKYSNEKVRTAADLSMRGASAILGENLVKSIVSTVDGFLVVSQNYVDYVLPPTKEEQKKKDDPKEDDKESPSSLVRLTRLSNTIRHRVLSTLVVKWENVQERTLDLIVTYPIQMIELTKTQLEPVIEYLTQLWESLRKETPEGDQTDKSSHVETELLHLAKLVSKQVAANFYPTNDLTLDEDDKSDDFNLEPVQYLEVSSSRCPDCSERWSFVGLGNDKTSTTAFTYVYLWISVMD